MAFLDFLFGKGEKTKEFQRFTPEQESYMGDVLRRMRGVMPAGFEYLQSILSQEPEMMARFERPAMRAFEEEILPSIAERFTGMFGPGAQRSSAFGQSLGQAGQRLAEALSAQRAGLGMQALGGLQALGAPGLTQMREQMYMPRRPGFLESMAPSLGYTLPMGLYSLFGGR